MRTNAWAILVLLAAAAMPASAEQWTKKFALTGKPELRVESNDGDIRVDTWNRQEIEARVLTTGWRIAPGEVQVTDRQTGDRVELEVRIPRFHFGFASRSLKIEVMLPRVANLDLHTGDGNIIAQSVAGELNFRTGDGNITLDGAKGEIRLSTGDGNIEAKRLDGSLRATTGDGKIAARGRFDLLHLETKDGDVSADVDAGSKMTGSWNLRSGDGNIVLRLPEGFGADFDAHTGDGRISLDFPVMVSGSLDRSTIRGKMNGGGATLTVRTGDGSIRVERL